MSETAETAPARAGPATNAVRAEGPNPLDYILVAGAMLMIGGGLFGLFTVHDTPKENLPIIASVISFLSGGVVGAYAGYRWGASDAMKRQPAGVA